MSAWNRSTCRSTVVRPCPSLTDVVRAWPTLSKLVFSIISCIYSATCCIYSGYKTCINTCNQSSYTACYAAYLLILSSLHAEYIQPPTLNISKKTCCIHACLGAGFIQRVVLNIFSKFAEYIQGLALNIALNISDGGLNNELHIFIQGSTLKSWINPKS